MITEDYISFETAKLLKEKGFEYNPDESYWLIDANNNMYWISSIGAYDYVDVPTESFQRPKNGYRLVTQAVAMKWLREVYKLSIEPYYDEVLTWVVDIKHIGKHTDTREFETVRENCYKTYEEACEAAIKFCLENLI